MPLVGVKAVLGGVRSRIARLVGGRKPVETVPIRIPQGLASAVTRAFGQGFGEVRVIYGRTWKRSGWFANNCYIAEGVGKVGKRMVYRLAAFHPKSFRVITGVNASNSWRPGEEKQVTVHFLEGAKQWRVGPPYQHLSLIHI